MRSAFASGYENLAAWTDLLDRINVFPVADGDTGANLRISLAPLHDCKGDHTQTIDLLVRCAVGNSGNIAAAFFQEFCRSDTFGDLAENAEKGSVKAWQSLATPQAGTMLNVFDSLAAILGGQADPVTLYPVLCRELQAAVAVTAQALPNLRQAGVVDAGALGMYIFFEGFFRHLAGAPSTATSILELFAGQLTINADFHATPTGCFCVNAVIHGGDPQVETGASLAALGDSVVVLPSASGMKVHVHTANRQQLRTELSALGEIVAWSDEALDQGGVAGFPSPAKPKAVHIMTDAAGSLPREMARRHGITLLDSYILTHDSSSPESLCSPAELYVAMCKGGRVSTAQASLFERHQHYQSVCRQYGRTIYLCVGSAFTGNYAVARRWQEENDPDNLLQVVDTGAASGRLGLLALLTARFAEQAASSEEVMAFVAKTMASCEEYVFIDQVRYLAAGGRVSRAGGFFADLLHMKPVISPASGGVRKVGLVRNRTGQLAFALQKLEECFTATAAPVILLQHTDNDAWVANTVQPRVRELLPGAEILLVPLSLTSGVHMGPGTWSMAWVGGEKAP